jgi:3-hydroxyisobutyrate dehydrogenase-like beta-hydroxyacid dehydrogenase
LIACLKDDASIIEVLINQNLISTLKKNSFIIDHSTTSLDLIQKISSNQEVIANNVSFFDAPMSGGESGAINASLSVMFGGPLKKINTIKKLMNSYASSIVHIGPSGHGQLTKMINQLCIAGIIQGLSEGIVLGKTSKLDMDKVFIAISNGAAQSWQMDNRFKTMIEDRFDFGFAVDLMIKDLKIAINHAKSNHLELEISKNDLQKYKKLSSKNMGNFDTSSLIKLFDI